MSENGKESVALCNRTINPIKKTYEKLNLNNEDNRPERQWCDDHSKNGPD